jgi:hypothetical protein
MELLSKSELEKAKFLLVKAGFVDKDKKRELDEKRRRTGEKDEKKFIRELGSDAAKYAENEKMEIIRLDEPVETDYPKPIQFYRFVFESPTASIEETYFWLLNHLKVDQGFSGIIKISDIFTASELSAISGTLQYRLAQQQEKAAQYLRGISEMVKSLFQIVREIRILNEKLKYYEDSKKPGDVGRAAEIALKGQWVDLVEGGAKNPASVYGLAQQVGFTIVPDLFFRIKVDKSEDVARAVKALEFNEKVKEVITRKLVQYYIWKRETEKELLTRRAFILKYLRQHYNTIKLYMSWVKPYLRTIRRMGMSEKHLAGAEIISGFETSRIDLEFLSYKPPAGDFHPVILASFSYSTMPQMSFMAEGYQKGPIHVGRVEVILRSYIWTSKQIENYKSYRDDTDMELLKDIDETIAQTMEALGEEFKKYLELEGEVFEKKEEKKREEEPMLEPFTALFTGFRELFSALIPALGESRKKEKTQIEKESDKSKAKGMIDFSLYQTYKNFKKSHNFLSW